MTPTTHPRPLSRPGSALRPGRALTRFLVAGGVVGAVALGAVLVGVPAGQATAAEPGARASSADLAGAEVRSFDITTVATGELEARNQIEIRSQLESGSTIKFIVPEGSRVSRGQLLVSLNSDEIESTIEQEELSVESARLDVAAAETDLRIQISDNAEALRDAQLQVELAQLALDQWRQGDVTKRRKQLQLDVEQAQRNLDRLSDKFERSEELFSQGFLSKNERDTDEIAFIDAKAKLETARLDQDIYEKFDYPRDERTKMSDVDKAQSNLERVQEKNEINLRNRESNLTTKKRQLELREQRMAKLKAQLAACTVNAPSDGLVVYATSIDRNRWGGGDGPLQIGQQVYPNQLLIVLPDTSEMIASVRVHESLAGRLRPGQTAKVKIDAAGAQTFEATVESIGVLAESGGWRDPNRREYTVRLALGSGNEEGKLKPSMRCEGDIQLGRVEDALSVPVQSIFSDGALRYVYRPTGSKYERVPVQVGRRSSVFAEITAGLSAGDSVLLREPTPGEILARPIADESLAAVGLRRDDRGEITPMMPAGPASALARGGAPAAAAQGGAAKGTQAAADGAAAGESEIVAPTTADAPVTE